MNNGIFAVTNPKNGLIFYVQATDQDHANRIAAAMSSKEEETSQNIEDDFRDMMPTSEEFYADAMGPEPYEPSPYDGTYSEM